jgi:manganese-dependent ADP-ribose/CDP-alcohol diphosphatase
MLAGLRERKAANAQEWDGAVGDEQRAWLRGVLRKAQQAGERAILFCHHPALRESSTPAHLLWDHEEVVKVVDEFPNVAAFMNGHDHNGGYAARRGVHYVTFPGMVESGAATSYTLVDVYRDRLELRGTGSAPSRTLRLQ